MLDENVFLKQGPGTIVELKLERAYFSEPVVILL